MPVVSKRSSPMVLLAEPDDDIAVRLAASLQGVHDVRRFGTFHEAREQLQQQPPDLLVSNLRLSEYNGLQLVYLMTIARVSTRAIVYTIQTRPGSRERYSTRRRLLRHGGLPRGEPSHLPRHTAPSERSSEPRAA
jgi:CheY-like chemotaxis protein